MGKRYSFYLENILGRRLVSYRIWTTSGMNPKGLDIEESPKPYSPWLSFLWIRLRYVDQELRRSSTQLHAESRDKKSTNNGGGFVKL